MGRKWFDAMVGDMYGKLVGWGRSRWRGALLSKPKSLRKTLDFHCSSHTSLPTQTKDKHLLVFCRHVKPYLAFFFSYLAILYHQIFVKINNSFDHDVGPLLLLHMCYLVTSEISAFQAQVSNTTGWKGFMVWEIPNGLLIQGLIPRPWFHSSDNYWSCGI